MRDTETRGRSLTISCLLMLFLSPPILLAALIPAAQATTVVSVFPSTVTVPVGQDFSINITVASVFGLYGWQFKLSWNATLLDVVNVSEGSFLKSSGTTFFTYAVNETTWSNLVADCTLLGMVPGASGSGTLATITFHAEAGGQCLLDLYDVLLLNPAEQPIPCQVFDGYGYLTSEFHDVAITDTFFSPVAIPQGETIDINVSAQNQGSFLENLTITVCANSTVIGAQPISLAGGESTTASFTWDTAGFAVGDYTILASASTVPGEVEVADNNRTAGAPATVLLDGHDIAVVRVESGKTFVGQGYTMKVFVTVKNYGTFAETFDTAVKANATIIQVKSATLASGASQLLLFTWNTSAFPMGDYLMSADASPVAGESNTADNTLADGTVHVGIPGDVDGNRLVNMLDLYNIAVRFGAILGQPSYVPNCDIDDSNLINMLDLYIAAVHYGQDES